MIEAIFEQEGPRLKITPQTPEWHAARPQFVFMLFFPSSAIEVVTFPPPLY